jgi:hypothetical protein
MSPKTKINAKIRKFYWEVFWENRERQRERKTEIQTVTDLNSKVLSIAITVVRPKKLS